MVCGQTNSKGSPRPMRLTLPYYHTCILRVRLLKELNIVVQLTMINLVTEYMYELTNVSLTF